jgi:hypothetical protein
MTAAKKPNATHLQFQQRAEQFLRIRLDGATFLDCKNFAVEAGWGAGLSDRSIYRVMAAADKLMAKYAEKDRDKLLLKTVYQYDNLYARCVAAGDYGVAKACLDSRTKLLGLWPREAPEAATAPLSLTVIEELILHKSDSPALPALPAPLPREVIVDELHGHNDNDAGARAEPAPEQQPAGAQGPPIPPAERVC